MSKKHSHYYKDVSELSEVDVYRVCDLFKVEDHSGALQHAIKKLLLPGGRGAGKDMRKDIREAVDTLQRKLDMMEEDLIIRAVEMAERRDKYLGWLKEHAEYDGPDSSEEARAKARDLINKIEGTKFHPVDNPFSEENWALE